jgi:MFS family permease
MRKRISVLIGEEHRETLVKGPSWLSKLGTLSILYVSVFLTRIGFGSILIIFPIYLNIPATQSSLAGIVTALYPAVEGFSALPVGTFVDLRGRRRAFVAGMTMISILTFLIGLSNNLILVGSAHALEGLAAAMVTVASLTMITDLTVKENRGAGMGGFDLSNLAGYGAGILLGLAFSHIFASNLGYSFLVISAVMGASAVFVYFALHEPMHSSREQRNLRGIYDTFTGEVIGILPVWFALTIVLGFFLFLPRLVKNAGVSDLGQSAPLILLALVVLGVGAVMFGRLSDKVGRMKTMLIGALGELGFLLVLPDLFQRLVVIPPNTPWIDSYNMVGPIIIVGGLLFFLGSALIPSILAYIGDKASKEFRGSAMGLYSLMLSGGIAIGTVLAGVSDDLGGVQAVFYSAAVIFGGLGLTSAWLLHKQQGLAKIVDPKGPVSKPI